MIKLVRVLMLAAVLWTGGSATAAETCLVVGVTDGDTLTVRCGATGNYEQVKVRLAEIDAPEKGQAFGQRSRVTLAALCFGALASIDTQSRDRYGRSVARVVCRGQDANLEQVRRGMAWAYRSYQRDPEFSRVEADARGQRRGLWTDLDPVAPWEWRQARRTRADDIRR